MLAGVAGAATGLRDAPAFGSFMYIASTACPGIIRRVGRPLLIESAAPRSQQSGPGGAPVISGCPSWREALRCVAASPPEHGAVSTQYHRQRGRPEIWRKYRRPVAAPTTESGSLRQSGSEGELPGGGS